MTDNDGVSDFCIFCAIAAGTAPSFMVYEDETAVAFLDLAPVRRGHTLVIPRRHVPDVMAEQGAQAVIDVGQAVHEVSRRLVDVFKADGITVLQSNGAAAGQVVFHLHLHLVPRFVGDRPPIGWTRDATDADEVAATHALINGAPG
jgi:histidine triad (HIT) family protein